MHLQPSGGKVSSATRRSYQLGEDKYRRFAPITEFYLNQRPGEESRPYQRKNKEHITDSLISSGAEYVRKSISSSEFRKRRSDSLDSATSSSSNAPQPLLRRKRQKESLRAEGHECRGEDAALYHRYQRYKRRSGDSSDSFRRSLTQSSPFGIHYEPADSEEDSSSLFNDPVFILEFEQDYREGRERRRKLKKLAANLRRIESMTREINNLTEKDNQYDSDLQKEERTQRWVTEDSTHPAGDINPLTPIAGTRNVSAFSRHSGKETMSQDSLYADNEQFSKFTENFDINRSLSSNDDTSNNNKKGPAMGPTKAISDLCLTNSELSRREDNKLSTSLMSLPLSKAKEDQTPEQKYIANILYEIFEADSECTSELESLYSEVQSTTDETNTSATSASSNYSCSVEFKSDGAYFIDRKRNGTLNSDETIVDYDSNSGGNASGDLIRSSATNSDSGDTVSDISLIFQTKGESGSSADDEEHATVCVIADLPVIQSRESLVLSTFKKNGILLDVYDDVGHCSNRFDLNYSRNGNSRTDYYVRSVSKDSDSATLFGSETVNFDKNSRVSAKNLSGESYQGNLTDCSIEESFSVAHCKLPRAYLRSSNSNSRGDSCGSSAEYVSSEKSSDSSDIDHNKCFDDIQYSASNNSDDISQEASLGDAHCTSNNKSDSDDDEYFEAQESFPKKMFDSYFIHSDRQDSGSVFETDRSVGLSYLNSELRITSGSSTSSSGSISSGTERKFQAYFDSLSEHSADGILAESEDVFESYCCNELDRFSSMSVYQSSSDVQSVTSAQSLDADESDGCPFIENPLYVQTASVSHQEWESMDDLANCASDKEKKDHALDSVYFSPIHFSVCKSPTYFVSTQKLQIEGACDDMPKEYAENLHHKNNKDICTSSEFCSIKVIDSNSALGDNSLFSNIPDNRDSKLSNKFEIYNMAHKNSDIGGEDNYLGSFYARRATYSDRKGNLATEDYSQQSSSKRGSLYENSCENLLNRNNNKNCSDICQQTSVRAMYQKERLRSSFYDNYNSDSGSSDKYNEKNAMKRHNKLKKLSLKNTPPSKLHKFPTSPDDYINYEGLPFSKYDELCRAIAASDKLCYRKNYSKYALLNNQRAYSRYHQGVGYSEQHFNKYSDLLANRINNSKGSLLMDETRLKVNCGSGRKPTLYQIRTYSPSSSEDSNKRRVDTQTFGRSSLLRGKESNEKFNILSLASPPKPQEFDSSVLRSSKENRQGCSELPCDNTINLFRPFISDSEKNLDSCEYNQKDHCLASADASRNTSDR